MKMNLKKSCAKWRPFCLGGDEFKVILCVVFTSDREHVYVKDQGTDSI